MKDVKLGKRKFTSDLINIIANNIINRIRGKGVRVNRINSKSEFIRINKVGDSTYEIGIDVNNINTSVRNSKIYKLGVIIR